MVQNGDQIGTDFAQSRRSAASGTGRRSGLLLEFVLDDLDVKRLRSCPGSDDIDSVVGGTVINNDDLIRLPLLTRETVDRLANKR